MKDDSFPRIKPGAGNQRMARHALPVTDAGNEANVLSPAIDPCTGSAPSSVTGARRVATNVPRPRMRHALIAGGCDDRSSQTARPHGGKPDRPTRREGPERARRHAPGAAGTLCT